VEYLSRKLSPKCYILRARAYRHYEFRFHFMFWYHMACVKAFQQRWYNSAAWDKPPIYCVAGAFRRIFRRAKLTCAINFMAHVKFPARARGQTFFQARATKLSAKTSLPRVLLLLLFRRRRMSNMMSSGSASLPTPPFSTAPTAAPGSFPPLLSEGRCLLLHGRR
jgi:hypothetical protein